MGKLIHLLLLVTSTIAGTLDSVSVSLSDTKTGATSTVTATFTVVGAVATGGKIKVTFPSGFTVPSTISGPTISATSGLTGSTVTASCSGSVATVELGSGTSLAAGASAVVITIPGCTNPSTAGTTATFQIQTPDSSDAAIDEKTTGITTAITAATTTTTTTSAPTTTTTTPAPATTTTTTPAPA